MATQKQRRRRAKEKRHEYDLVYINEEGVEQPVEREESPRSESRAGKGSTASTSGKGKSGRASRGREVKPPSWPKVFKRAAIFAPLFLVTVMLLGGGKITLAGAIFQTLLLLAVFVPFSYFMDRVMWRQQQKRLTRDS